MLPNSELPNDLLWMVVSFFENRITQTTAEIRVILSSATDEAQPRCLHMLFAALVWPLLHLSGGECVLDCTLDCGVADSVETDSTSDALVFCRSDPSSLGDVDLCWGSPCGSSINWFMDPN